MPCGASDAPTPTRWSPTGWSGSRHADVSTFEDLTLPLGVVALNLATGEDQVISHGPLLPALLASSAIPGVFPPVVIDGQPMVDGGLLANIPLAQATSVAAAGTLIVLDCTVPAPITLDTDVVEMITLTTRLQSRDQLRAALPHLTQDTTVICLPAPSARQTSVFDLARTAALIEDSREATTRFLAGPSPDRAGPYGDPFSRYVPRWDAGTPTATTSGAKTPRGNARPDSATTTGRTPTVTGVPPGPAGAP